LKWNFEDYDMIKKVILSIKLKTNKYENFTISLDFKNKEGVILSDGENNKLILKKNYHWALKDIIELMIPLELLKLKASDVLELKWSIIKDNNSIEEWPYFGFLKLFLPEKVSDYFLNEKY
jgi:hypothetical protein